MFLNPVTTISNIRSYWRSYILYIKKTIVYDHVAFRLCYQYNMPMKVCYHG